LQIAWENFDKLDIISKKVKKELSNIPWVINIETSRKPLPLEFRLNFDSSKLEINSLTLPQVSFFIKNSIDWTEATKIYMWNTEVLVKTRYSDEYTDTLDKIKDLKLKNNKWQYVYLRDLLSVDLEKSVFSIQRIDQKRVVSISASADKTTTWKEIKAIFDKNMKDYKIPNWYEFITWWANEENQKSVQSLLVSMLFWLMFIVWTLVILFDSYKQSVMVLVTIPLSLIWVFYWLTLFWQPLSFPWLIWLVALFWIVIRNWIILFDKINQNINDNIDFVESIIDAWKTRLEPVFLTSVCTVLWMIPLTLSNPTWTSLWLSIIFWLSVSTIFTLVVLPTLYFMFVKQKN
jgi:HAE1 family hydrophobic/amphiphilic exporter-1